METIVLLIRHGVTRWHAERRLLGHRDEPLSEEGRAQAAGAARALGALELGELLTSPLFRAVQTAETIGARCGIEVAREPRLIDVDAGSWSGMSLDENAATAEYRAFIAGDPAQAGARAPGGESLEEVRRRAVNTVEQALGDNPSGAAIAMVSHANVIRVILSHYLGSALGNYHRVRINPGSISALAFADDRQLPRVLAINSCDDIAAALRAEERR